MINYRVGIAVLAAVSAAGCAAPGTTPAVSPSPVVVPSGCVPERVRWSAPVTEPRLTQVTLHQEDGDMTGRPVLDAPFTPSITGVNAPADWTRMLAASLSEHAGMKVKTGPAVLPDGGYGFPMQVTDDPAIPQTLFFEGATIVSAEFTVSCTTAPVTGGFTSWTKVDFGGLACGSIDPPTEPLARLAIGYCPATAAPRPSGYIDAVPFDEDEQF
ncbi:hypothetical protein [Actinoplanes aureus]|uniref:Lipoprotein n=1 Tax=Actinoplanes aureus TaxID=2792083 RepID=A0A931CJS9_9ACTN|nr:hypothetical protein [Actinoplanes aureus]MBG0569312.1 hypothetical protein [Actinoplanes aureus]